MSPRRPPDASALDSERAARASAIALLSLAMTAMGGCGSPPPAEVEEQPWEGTVTTEGGVTTVVNRAGSVWGGDATLVEEASIGVDVGEDPYMLGNIASVWANGDRIFAADSDGPSVRVFDFDGNFLMEVGREGEGPGEFRSPNSVVTASDGRIFVREGFPGGRINVYDRDGNYVETRRGDPLLASGAPMLITDDDVVFTQTRAGPEGRDVGMGIAGRDGIEGEVVAPPDFAIEPAAVFVNDQVSLGLPLLPRVTWAMGPSRTIVAGYASRYRFELHHPDGAVTVVEKPYEPISISPDEAEWERRNTVRIGRRYDPSWNWNGEQIPATRPAYSRLQFDRNGRVWVTREAGVTRVEDCDPDPLDVTSGQPRSCWVPDRAFDVFGADGRFLGSVLAPAELDSLAGAYIRDDLLIAIVEDDAGTVMVKRYRIVLPG